MTIHHISKIVSRDGAGNEKETPRTLILQRGRDIALVHDKICIKRNPSLDLAFSLLRDDRSFSGAERDDTSLFAPSAYLSGLPFAFGYISPSFIKFRPRRSFNSARKNCGGKRGKPRRAALRAKTRFV